MKKNVLRLAIILLLVVLCVMQFSACSDEAPTPDQSGNGQTGGETGGDNDTETPASKLAFELNVDGQSYTLRGLSDKTVTKLTIPSTYQGLPVTSIGARAFFGCTCLTSITIPASVTSIGYYAFYGCTGLTSITVDAGNTKYHSNGNCLIETESKTLILGCKNSVIPSDGSVTSIGYGAFEECANLISITIPDSMASIGSGAFRGCTGLASITVDAGNTKYHSNGNCLIETESKTLILGCKNSVIPSDGSVTSIGDWAFYGCTGLTSLTIPNSVTSIGDGVFSDCTGLTSVTIPDSVMSIGSGAFSGCTSFTSIAVDTGNTKYHSNGNCLIETESKKLILGCKNSVIPSDGSVTSIGNGAFWKCAELTSITIPDSVTSIDSSAFDGCYKLVEVYNLSKLSIEAGSYGNGYVGYYAEAVHTSLDEKSILHRTDDGYVFCVVGEDVWLIGYTGTDALLNLPGSYDGRKYDMYDYALANCIGLTSVVIPNSVTSIGSYAFYGCTGLTSIIISNSVTSIGSSAFSRCTGLTSITIPNSVTSIEYQAFSGCTGLTSATIPNSVTRIGGDAFRDCTGLTSITIPNSVTSIGGFAFRDCTGLTSITIPNSVTSIGGFAFAGCARLTSITIPNSVTSIGELAFYGCTSLTSIQYNGTKEQWKAIEKSCWWSDDAGDFVVHCSDGDIAKTDA